MSAQQHSSDSKYGTSKKTLTSYITGLVGSLLLTLAAFGIVDKKLMSDVHLYITLSALAIAQLIVQVICFLRLNASAEGRWNLMPFLFAIVIIFFLAGGTLWIMYNLNYNMVH